MASSDWSQVTGGLSAGSLIQGVAAGLVPPPGGGSFVYGMRAIDAAVGGAALYANASGYGPIGVVGGVQMGGSVRGTLKRRTAGTTGFSPFLFLCLQGLSFSAMAYMLGLSDEIPSRIVLVKGPFSPVGNVTIPPPVITSPPTKGVLACSTATYAPGNWLQLRLDAIANGNGDVVLNCYFNDLTLGGASVASPTWIPIPGISQYIDDALGINTGTTPLAGLSGANGYAGFGMTKTVPNTTALFDELEVLAQTG
jgi:hypothetical protein